MLAATDAGPPRRRPARLPGGSLGIEEITRPAALEALAGEWSGLLEASPEASPFQSPQWLLAWLRIFLREGLWTLAFRRDGRLVGLAPLFLYPAPDGGRQLTLLGNGVSDRLDVLVRPQERAAVAEALEARLDRPGTWDRCDFRDLPAGSLLLELDLAARADLIEPEAPCPLAILPSRPEAVMDLLPARRRDDLKRCERRAAEAGALSFETADAAGLPQALETLLGLHDARWAGRGEPGPLADETVRAFHRAAAPALQARGWLRLHLLRIGGRPAAAQYVLRKGACAYSAMTCFDPAFSRLSPGLLVTRFALEQAVREGARRFDFLRGREPYKYLWGATDQAQMRRRLRR